MGIQERVEATAKELEGKSQAALGELTGNEKDIIEGQAKQLQAKAIQAKEDLKDAAKSIIDKT
jgi:uncharacterized protein YjbJ (UPF0337 family)